MRNGAGDLEMIVPIRSRCWKWKYRGDRYLCGVAFPEIYLWERVERALRCHLVHVRLTLPLFSPTYSKCAAYITLLTRPLFFASQHSTFQRHAGDSTRSRYHSIMFSSRFILTQFSHSLFIPTHLSGRILLPRH